MFDGGENEVSLTDVLNVVKQVLAGAEVEVPRLTGGVRDITGCAVMGMLPAAAGVDGGPEVVKNMAVGMPTFTRREPDFPDPDPVIVAEQLGPDVCVKGMGCELSAEVLGPSFVVLSDKGSRKGKIAEEAVGRHSEVLSWVVVISVRGRKGQIEDPGRPGSRCS